PHLIQLDFAAGDTASAWRALREFRKRAPNSDYARGYQAAFTLAFGAPQARVQARRALDTLSASALAHARTALFNFHTMEGLEMLSRSERARAGGGTPAAIGIVFGATSQGRRKAALDALSDRALTRATRLNLAYHVLSLDGIPDPRLESYLVAEPLDSLSASELLFAAAHAAEQ